MKNTWKPGVRKRIYEKFNGRCAYCGQPFNNNFTIDHLKPLLRHLNKEELLRYGRVRGDDCEDNYMPCCMSCNSSKSILSIEQFRDNVQSRIQVLNKTCSEYRIAKRFGLIEETIKPVVFYFEKMGGVNE